MWFGGTHGNDPDVVATPRVDDDEQTPGRAPAERNESPLTRVGFIVRNRDRVRIFKNRNRFRHADPVPSKIDSGLALFVPLKAHNVSVRTLRAYVKC